MSNGVWSVGNYMIADSQATAILRSSGLEPEPAWCANNKVSAEIDLSNLMFRKLESARQPVSCFPFINFNKNKLARVSGLTRVL